HWLSGIFLNLAIVFSGLLFAAAALAWCYRQLDSIDVKLYLRTLGIWTDIERAFVPCAVLLLIWLMAHVAVFVVNLAKRTTGQSRWEPLLTTLAALTLASALMAVAALLNTGDISLNLSELELLNQQKEVNKDAVQLRWMLVVLLVVALLPYLRPQDLLRSGTQPRTVVHSWIYWIASYAFLFGIPLVLFGYLAREDISGFNESRPNRHRLQRLFVPDWNKLLAPPRQIRSAALEPFELASLPHLAVLMAVVGMDPGPDLAVLGNQEKDARALFARWSEMVQQNPQSIQVALRLEKEKQELERRWFWQRSDDWPWQGRKTWREHTLAKRQYLHDRIANDISDRCIEHPRFFAAFQWLPKAGEKTLLPPTWTEDTVRKLVDLRERAAWLAANPQPPEAELQELHAINGGLFREYYGKLLREPTTVFATIVQPADQEYRLTLAGIFLVVFLVLALGISLNATSMHRFYRDRLADLWLKGREAEGLAAHRATFPHLPYFLINATANLQGRADRQQELLDVFVFSPRFCGSERTGYLATEEFHHGRFRLADAIAVSGAAVSPAVMRDPIRMMLLFLTNS
ncbi:MAG: hypothetical protein L0099_14185, partial [Acidobacteria bacterium]|nr:hypothetical protein [Acidobacteriota bacterium]